MFVCFAQGPWVEYQSHLGEVLIYRASKEQEFHQVISYSLTAIYLSLRYPQLFSRSVVMGV